MFGKKEIAVGLLLALVVLVFLVIVYLYTQNKKKSPFDSSDGSCGSRDQLCKCCGNESMTSQRVTEDRLTAVMTGAI